MKIHALKQEGKGEELQIYFKNIRIIIDHPEEYAKDMDLPAKVLE